MDKIIPLGGVWRRRKWAPSLSRGPGARWAPTAAWPEVISHDTLGSPWAAVAEVAQRAEGAPLACGDGGGGGGSHTHSASPAGRQRGGPLCINKEPHEDVAFSISLPM